MPHLLAALAADGLTVTPTQTALAGETFRAYIDAKHPSKTIFHIERLLAIGEAVERLPDHAVIKRKGERWHAYLYHREAMMPHGWETAMTRTTLPEAIAAALDDQDDAEPSTAFAALDPETPTDE